MNLEVYPSIIAVSEEGISLNSELRSYEISR